MALEKVAFKGKSRRDWRGSYEIIVVFSLIVLADPKQYHLFSFFIILIGYKIYVELQTS